MSRKKINIGLIKWQNVFHVSKTARTRHLYRWYSKIHITNTIQKVVELRILENPLFTSTSPDRGTHNKINFRLSVKSLRLLSFQSEGTSSFPYGAAGGRTKAPWINWIPLKQDLQGASTVVCAAVTLYKHGSNFEIRKSKKTETKANNLSTAVERGNKKESNTKRGKESEREKSNANASVIHFGHHQYDSQRNRGATWQNTFWPLELVTVCMCVIGCRTPKSIVTAGDLWSKFNSSAPQWLLSICQLRGACVGGRLSLKGGAGGGGGGSDSGDLEHNDSTYFLKSLSNTHSSSKWYTVVYEKKSCKRTREKTMYSYVLTGNTHAHTHTPLTTENRQLVETDEPDNRTSGNHFSFPSLILPDVCLCSHIHCWKGYFLNFALANQEGKLMAGSVGPFMRCRFFMSIKQICRFKICYFYKLHQLHSYFFCCYLFMDVSRWPVSFVRSAIVIPNNALIGQLLLKPRAQHQTDCCC